MTIHLRPYPAYRNSGVPWLGDVPVHWDLVKTKYLFRERSEKGFPDEPLLAATQTKGVVPKELYENRTVVALKDLHLLKLVRVQDFVISLRSFQGGIEYAHHQGIISPAYTILQPSRRVHPPFFAVLFKSKPFIHNLSLFLTGIREGQNIDYERMSRSLLPVPPPVEQERIARFTSYADQQVNRLIKGKHRLIALLEEQKQAMLYRAITRGIDPDFQLKRSGVSWIGHVPEHWEVSALSTRYSVQLGKMLDTKRITGHNPVPYLRNADVQWDRVSTTDLPTMDISEDEYERYTVKPGDLLVCEGGEVGRAAFWDGSLPVCGYQKALHRVRPRKNHRDTPRWLFYLMQYATKQGIFAADGNENTIAHLTAEKFRRHRFVFPSKEEQLAITSYLDIKLAELNLAIGRARKEVELIREYRARLVADVVTGKLDVRDVVLPKLEEALKLDAEDLEDKQLPDEGGRESGGDVGV